MLNVFLNVIADGSGWQQRLSDLFDKNKEILIQDMGFHPGWSADPFWGIHQ